MVHMQISFINKCTKQKSGTLKQVEILLTLLKSRFEGCQLYFLSPGWVMKQFLDDINKRNSIRLDMSLFIGLFYPLVANTHE